MRLPRYHFWPLEPGLSAARIETLQAFEERMGRLPFLGGRFGFRFARVLAWTLATGLRDASDAEFEDLTNALEHLHRRMSAAGLDADGNVEALSFALYHLLPPEDREGEFERDEFMQLALQQRDAFRQWSSTSEWPPYPGAGG